MGEEMGGEGRDGVVNAGAVKGDEVEGDCGVHCGGEGNCE